MVMVVLRSQGVWTIKMEHLDGIGEGKNERG